MNQLGIFVALIFGHFLADYPLQGDFLARGKNRLTPIPVPNMGRLPLWIHCLTAHAAIHAGFVGLITGRWELALAEFVLHWLIDLCKCEGFFSYDTDQFLHVICKAGYVLFL